MIIVLKEVSQHDVQELNRILFSALEQSLVGLSDSDLLDNLYKGTIVNQVAYFYKALSLPSLH